VHVVHESEIRSELDCKGILRASSIADQIVDIAITTAPQEIVIEGYAYGNMYSLATLVEIGAIVRYALLAEEMIWSDVAPTVLKKFVTGSGRAAKAQMVQSVFMNWGFEAKTHNTADAFGLSVMGLAIGERMDGLSDGQQELVTKNCIHLDFS
jgi:Holliday junction resolvasome RuvABC endonuclease subunit